MFGKYDNNKYQIVPFFNENFQNNWKEIVQIPHKYFGYKTQNLLSKKIIFDLDNRERMICNMNHIYSNEDSRNEIIVYYYYY